MPINYAIKKVKNPNGIEGTEYFHGQAIKKAVAADFSLKRISSEAMA